MSASSAAILIRICVGFTRGIIDLGMVVTIKHRMSQKVLTKYGTFVTIRSMNVMEIRITLANAGKKVTRESVCRYLKKFDIAPSGVRQRPQQYPADSADRILAHLGFSAVTAIPQYTDADALPRAGKRRAAEIVSMKKLNVKGRKKYDAGISHSRRVRANTADETGADTVPDLRA